MIHCDLTRGQFFLKLKIKKKKQKKKKKKKQELTRNVYYSKTLNM